jgi:NADH-ubiquinone oxidoreductase chain 4
MVLAGTVLKLATYGVLRVLLPIMPEATAYYTPLVQTIAVVSLVYSSLATLRQGDFKALVAYSSVAHMAVVLLGLVSNTSIGITGAIILSIAHGFVSPALFMLMGGVLYDRFHSRQLRYYRGLASTMPLFSVLSFLFVCANMGVPLTLNWVGEFIALAGTYQSSVVAGSLGATGIVLSACYSIWLWGRMNAGSYSPHLGHTIDITRREAAVLMPLLLFTILLGVKPGIIMDTIAAAVSAVLY